LPDPAFLLQLLSEPELRAAGQDGAELSAGKPLALLAYLAVERRPVPREEVAALLWPDADGARARASVRQALWTLRQALGQDCFASDDPISLAHGAVETDLELLAAALEEGDLGAAEQLWKAPPLQDLEFPRAKGWQGWVEEVRNREETKFGDALARAAASELVRGRAQAAGRWLRRAVEVQPHKTAHRLALVEALLDARQLSDAALAIAEARHAATEPEQLALLDVLDDRLAALRYGPMATQEPPTLKTEFVGRATEFSKLSRKWRRARSGVSEVGLVLGPPGIGKTRLSEELRQLAASEGGAVLSVKAVEVERSLDWGIASELVRGLHGLPGAAGISNRSASVLARLVPSLAGWKDSLPLGGAGGSVEAAAVTDALLDLVGAVAEESALLLIVDDLQWVDKHSRAALSHLARAAGREPVMVLFTCRTGEADPEVAKALDSLSRLPGADPVELGPLGPSEVSELLVLLLEPLEPESLHDLAARVFGITRGNPLFIVEILKLLQAEGLLEVGGGGKWRVVPSCLSGALPVPKTVESAIRRQLDDLGAVAQHLAAHLAAQARPLPPEELRRLSKLDPFEVSEGLRQLFERDLIRRNADGRLQFVHDAVEAAARRHLRADGRSLGGELGLGLGVGRGWRAGHRWREWGFWRTPEGVGVLAVAAIGVAALGFAAWNGGAGWGGLRAAPEPTYPYGRGRVFVQTTDGARWVTPPAREGEEWTVTGAEVPFPHPVLKGPVRIADGSVHWFSDVTDDPEAPPFVGIPLPDGGVDPVWKVDGDAGFWDLSPDGRFALLGQENLEVAHYAHDLISVDLERGAARVLFRLPEMLAGADWSPDGQRIALVARYARDSLHVITPDGGRVVTFGFPEAADLGFPSWCEDSDRLVFPGVVEGVARLGVVRVSTGAHWFSPLAVPGLSSFPACVGSGDAVAAGGLVDGGLGVVVFDLRRDTVLAFPGIPVRPGLSAVWLPDDVPPVAQVLSIEGGDAEVAVGETVRLTALARFSDGESRPAPVEWRSGDPSVAWVDSTGVVIANHTGTVPVVARFAGWLEDTVSVRVTAAGDVDVLFRDDFSGGTLEAWDLFGYPPAVIVEVGGERVLSLSGDGRYNDGVTARRTFPLRGGATVELQFRLPLTRTDRQRIGLCLEPAGDPPAPTPEDLRGGAAPGALCFGYPSQENVKFDPREAAIYFSGLGHRERFHLPPDFDPSRWTGVALQLRPDGTAALWMNGSRVHEMQARLPVPEGSLWRVRLMGAAADTHLHVRSVTVWPGQRY